MLAVDVTPGACQRRRPRRRRPPHGRRPPSPPPRRHVGHVKPQQLKAIDTYHSTYCSVPGGRGLADLLLPSQKKEAWRLLPAQPREQGPCRGSRPVGAAAGTRRQLPHPAQARSSSEQRCRSSSASRRSWPGNARPSESEAPSPSCAAPHTLFTRWRTERCSLQATPRRDTGG